MKSLDVVVAADRNYVRPLAVTVHSLCGALSEDERCRIHVLADGYDDELRSQVVHGLDGQRVSVAWIDIDSSSLGPVEANPQWRHITRTSFARLLIPKVIPPSISRLVYVDVDVVVRSSLAPLMNIELQGRSTAAVRDPAIGWLGGPHVQLPWYDYDLDPRLPYFNAGVLVIDVDEWRSEHIAERALELASSRQFRYLDQDALNIVLAGRWTPLHARWNSLPFHRRDSQLGVAWVLDESEQFDEALSDPAVVHYAGPVKPWSHKASVERRSEWYEVLARTSFAGWQPASPSLAWRASRRVRRTGRVLLGRS